jgi:hypothetical protein
MRARHTRVKLVLHDGFGLWCATKVFAGYLGGFGSGEPVKALRDAAATFQEEGARAPNRRKFGSR